MNQPRGNSSARRERDRHAAENRMAATLILKSAAPGANGLAIEWARQVLARAEEAASAEQARLDGL